MKKLDLVGQKFGRLTVKESTGKMDVKGSRWRCVCDCGNTVDVLGVDLRRGGVKSCGCLFRDLANSRRSNLVGQTFGKLTVDEIAGKTKSGNYKWKCTCKCGNVVEVGGGQLKSGNTKSCGCSRQESQASRILDLSGQVFGRLTANEIVGKTKEGRIKWGCTCSCGNTRDVDAKSLRSGSTTSCGCLAQEAREDKKLRFVGQTFGRLTVVEFAGYDNHKRETWRCTCSCGNTMIAGKSRLIGGHVKSCGCLTKEISSEVNTIHGHTSRKRSLSLTYICWQHMKNRCQDKNSKEYKDYGGRGITVCPEWSGSFSAFLRDMGEKPDNLSLDRIDNNGNYEPGNCRWATNKEQCRNKRSNKFITYNGETRTLTDWTLLLPINKSTVLNRIYSLKWSIEKAFSTPPYGSKNSRKDVVVMGDSPGYSKTRTYRSLSRAKSRCYTPTSKGYKNYGGRGITVCDRWLDKENGYFNFLADMGERPKGMSLDRIDNNGNYEPGNCRWATNEEQGNNTRVNRKIKFDGKLLSVSQWARKLNMDRATLHCRLYKFNWSVKKSFTTPVRGGEPINTI